MPRGASVFESEEVPGCQLDLTQGQLSQSPGGGGWPLHSSSPSYSLLEKISAEERDEPDPTPSLLYTSLLQSLSPPPSPFPCQGARGAMASTSPGKGGVAFASICPEVLGPALTCLIPVYSLISSEKVGKEQLVQRLRRCMVGTSDMFI